MIGAIYAGPPYDKGYVQTMMAVGSFMLVFGMFMTSLCTKYYQVVLAQGIVIGIGLGFLFLPALGIIATYFSSKRGLTMGIASSGSSISKYMHSHLEYELLARSIRTRYFR